MAQFNQSASSFHASSINTMKEAFKAFYVNQPHHALPKEDKNSDYWSEMWYQFGEVYSTSTFLPYLFSVGCLDLTLWEVFQKEGDIPFHKAVKLSGDLMDLSETLIYQPHWLDYPNLEKDGANLEEFLETVQEKDLFSAERTMEYLQSNCLYSKEQAEGVFKYLGITPEEPTLQFKPILSEVNEVKPMPTVRPVLPLIDLINDDENLTLWRGQIEQGMDPVCYEALQWLRDERELPEFYSMYGTKFQRSLAYYALIPLWEAWVSKAISEGNVFAFETSDNPTFGFAKALGIDTITPESIDLECDGLDPELKGKYLLVKPPYSGNSRKTLAALVEGGMKLVTLADLHAQSIANADITEKDVVRFLLSMGAKRDMTTGEYNLSPRKYVSFKIKFLTEEGVWSYREDDGRVLKTRLFYGVNGLAPKSSHAVFLMALSYLVQGSNYQQIKGRRAFLANLFQDEVTVGWSHPILDQFIPRKLGTLQVGVNHATWLLDVAKDSDFMSVLEAYDAKGYSSFVHKGGKYAVIEAECTGFSVLPKNIDDLVKQYADDEEGLRAAVMAAKETLSPEDMETFVGWLADKLPKYTGRALWLVPSAAMIPAEKPLEYEDVADFINSF